MIEYASEMEIVFIDGLILTSDTEALKVFDTSESNSVLFSFYVSAVFVLMSEKFILKYFTFSSVVGTFTVCYHIQL